MVKQRVSDKIYARGVRMPVHVEEMATPAEPKQAELYLESDSRYRWYEEGEPSEVFGETLHAAVEAAHVRWHDFQVIEVEGHAVSSESQFDLPERYAADDLEKRRKRAR
jgi:hypothetical protein